MSFDALKNSPIPALYHLGYRIVRSHSNKKKEIVIHFAKQKNVVNDCKDEEVQEIYHQTIKKIKTQSTGTHKQIKKYDKPSFGKKLIYLINRVLFCGCLKLGFRRKN